MTNINMTVDLEFEKFCNETGHSIMDSSVYSAYISGRVDERKRCSKIVHELQEAKCLANCLDITEAIEKDKL